MPELERLQLAVSLAIDEKIDIDMESVASAVMQLASGDEFAYSKGGTADLGSTVGAVRLLREVGAPVPPGTLGWLRERLSEALSDHDVQHIANTIAPLLSVMAPEASYLPAYRAQIEWVESKLLKTGGQASLATAATLAPAVRTLAMDSSRLRQVCSDVPALLSTATTSESIDPHIISDALTVGCNVDFKLPPSAVWGWPTTEALSTKLQASVDGAIIASTAGVLERYRSGLTVWLHEIRKESRRETDFDQILNLVLVNQLGIDAPTSSLGGELPRAIVAVDSPGSLFPLTDAWLRGIHTTASTLGPAIADVKGRKLNMMRLVADELRSRITGSEPLHERVLSDLDGFRLARGAYAMDTSLRQPSIWATILADWIADAPITMNDLRKLGFCTDSLECYSSTARAVGTEQPTLQVLAAVLGQDQPGRVFPLAV